MKNTSVFKNLLLKCNLLFQLLLLCNKLPPKFSSLKHASLCSQSAFGQDTVEMASLRSPVSAASAGKSQQLRVTQWQRLKLLEVTSP